ncbi:hypothetical protein LZ31DRAFT_225079 [Colletotrichum somersetense]|nr:hypothetical protein LZ31DRAFT_225079 [Colletotrichum somersetense]
MGEHVTHLPPNQGLHYPLLFIGHDEETPSVQETLILSALTRWFIALRLPPRGRSLVRVHAFQLGHLCLEDLRWLPLVEASAHLLVASRSTRTPETSVLSPLLRVVVSVLILLLPAPPPLFLIFLTNLFSLSRVWS